MCDWQTGRVSLRFKFGMGESRVVILVAIVAIGFVISKSDETYKVNLRKYAVFSAQCFFLLQANAHYLMESLPDNSVRGSHLDPSPSN